jgi:hypothetical protein
MDLTRREFIQSTLRIAASMGVLGVATPVFDAADIPLLTLYDPRFDKARQTAEALARGSALWTVGSDITDLAQVLLEDTHTSRGVVIIGVTTESVPFCLRQLGRSAGQATLDCQRMDQDLFIWKLTVICA